MAILNSKGGSSVEILDDGVTVQIQLTCETEEQAEDFFDNVAEGLTSRHLRIVAAGTGPATPVALDQLKTLAQQIDDLHRAFGAPGNYGYGTPSGDALYALYLSGAAIKQMLDTEGRS